MPRPCHVQTDPQAQADFKQRLRPLLRDVATAFPQATVELWAVDEHRIGLKPILRKAWTLPGQRPVAPVEHRYAWRSHRSVTLVSTRGSEKKRKACTFIPAV